MANSRTLTTLVQEAVRESRRMERVSDCVRFVRATVRECQALQLFDDDLVEEQLAADAVPFIWTPSATIRHLDFVRYHAGADYEYPTFIKPSLRQREAAFYYYKSGKSIVFAGASVGMLIDVSYYSTLPALNYYDPKLGLIEPASYDLMLRAWTYSTEGLSAEAQEAARDAVTNWLIFDWYDLIMEGVLAKLYKASDDDRARTHYSQYKAGQVELVAMASGINS